MRNVTMLIMLATLTGCYEGSTLPNDGNWVKLSTSKDSIVDNTYALLDGKVYFGSFNGSFYRDIILHKKPIPCLKEVDISSFQIYDGSCYARDKNYVYAPTFFVFVDGVDEDHSGYYAKEDYILKGVSPKRFKYLRDGYAISDSRMFYNGFEIEWRNDILNESMPITESVIDKNVIIVSQE